MHSLNHPDFEQTGEHRDAKGKLFAPVFKIQGRRTLLDLRQILHGTILPHAREAFRLGICRAIFVEPEQDGVDYRESDSDTFYAESIVSNIGGDGTKLYYCERGSVSDEAACIHAHSSFEMMSNIAVEDGSLPGEYVIDDEEFIELLDEAAKHVDGDVGESVRQTLSQRRTANMRLQRVGQDLMKLHADTMQGKKEQVTAIHQNIADKGGNFAERFPHLGSMIAFSGDVIHFSNPYNFPDLDEPGVLFVERWGSKPR